MSSIGSLCLIDQSNYIPYLNKQFPVVVDVELSDSPDQKSPISLIFPSTFHHIDDRGNRRRLESFSNFFVSQLISIAPSLCEQSSSQAGYRGLFQTNCSLCSPVSIHLLLKLKLKFSHHIVDIFDHNDWDIASLLSVV